MRWSKYLFLVAKMGCQTSAFFTEFPAMVSLVFQMYNTTSMDFSYHNAAFGWKQVAFLLISCMCKSTDSCLLCMLVKTVSYFQVPYRFAKSKSKLYTYFHKMLGIFCRKVALAITSRLSNEIKLDLRAYGIKTPGDTFLKSIGIHFVDAKWWTTSL